MEKKKIIIIIFSIIILIGIILIIFMKKNKKVENIENIATENVSPYITNNMDEATKEFYKDNPDFESGFEEFNFSHESEIHDMNFINSTFDVSSEIE